MEKLFLRMLLLLLAVLLCISTFVACNSSSNPQNEITVTDSETDEESTSEESSTNGEESTTEAEDPVNLIPLVAGKVAVISIVYPSSYADYEYQAAQKLYNFILDNTGVRPQMMRDTETPAADVIEILVGNTNRTHEVFQSRSLDVGTYVLQYTGGSIVVNGSFDDALGYAVNAFLAGIREYGMKEEGVLSVPDLVMQFAYMAPLSANHFSFGNASFQSLTNCGEGCYLLYFDRASVSDFSAFYGVLLQNGMEKHEEPRMMMGSENNYYASCTNETTAVTMILSTHNGQARVFVEPKDDNGYFAYVNDNKAKVCEPLFMQIGTGVDSGMCYIFRFDNGDFFIVDGGFDDSSSDYGHLKSCRRIVDTLTKYAPNPNDIRVVGWLSTHPHIDHMGALRYFANNYRDYPNITVENVMYNHYSPGVLEEAELSSVESKYEESAKKLLKNGATIHRSHTGQVMEFGENAKLEIIYTHEMRMAAQTLTSGNGMSIVMRFTVEGQTFLITGDTTTKSNRVMEAMYGSLLKSDFYQTPHHGYGGNTNTLAGLVDPTWLLWPCNDTRYAIVKDFDHNAFFFGSSSHVQAAFIANNQTFVFQLPFHGTNYTVTQNASAS